MPVPLQAETFAGVDHQSLDLVVRLVREHQVVAPRPMVLAPGLLNQSLVHPNERRDHLGQRSLDEHVVTTAFALDTGHLLNRRRRGVDRRAADAGLTILDEVRHMAIVDCDDRSPATDGVEQRELLHAHSTSDVHHRGRLPNQPIRFGRSRIVVMADAISIEVRGDFTIEEDAVLHSA